MDGSKAANLVLMLAELLDFEMVEQLVVAKDAMSAELLAFATVA